MYNKKVVIIMGPPGSGKGTQANLVANKYNLYNFDSGKLLRSIFYQSGPVTDPEILAEKKINDSGGINSGQFFLRVSTDKIRSIAQNGEGIVFSGSPRTMYETLGDESHKGFLDNLDELYGKNNVIAFVLEIPDEFSLTRNGSRAVCKVCGNSVLGVLHLDLKQCPFCGGPLEVRVDDNPEIIKVRLEEYRKQTYPIIAEMEKREFKVNQVDATRMPYQIFEKITSIIDDTFKDQ